MIETHFFNGETANYPKWNGSTTDLKPIYALEHLATFKLKNESEMENPKDKIRTLIELDKSGSIWPQKMFICFSGQWVLMLDEEMKEIENFPGSLITHPTAFISEDPFETFNNILIFTVPGISLGNTEMHIFQVCDVSAVHLVEDLKDLGSGKIVTINRNTSSIKFKKNGKLQNNEQQFGIAAESAVIAAEKSSLGREQAERDVQVLNHCFEDIERFVARLQYAAEALHELKQRQNSHNTHGEGLLILRSRPPTENEFKDIFAKQKLALNYIIKSQTYFPDTNEPIHNIFTSLKTIADSCKDIYPNENIPENLIYPLFKHETIAHLHSCLNVKETELWLSLGQYWTQSKDQFPDQYSKITYHPTFYNGWSPDWAVEDKSPYIQLPSKKNTPSIKIDNVTWLHRLKTRNVKIAEVVFNKIANTDKELSVIKGEHLEIIDDSRNWWRARNSLGNVGYVPHTILKLHSYESKTNNFEKEQEVVHSSFVPENGHDIQQKEKTSIPRSYSMPNVPVPPPMPPANESLPNTPSGTFKRNVALASTITAMQTDDDNSPEEALLRNINDELKYTLMQRERRRDLEILKTPEVFINQKSNPSEVEAWLRAKGFSSIIINKLKSLKGDELFGLSPHDIENYFGQKESRRLISQIVLQKNISEYKTIRSSELSAKLAKAREKADKKLIDPNEVF